MVEDSNDMPRPLAEISHGPSAFEAFLDRNQKGMVVVAILLAAAGCGVIVYRGMQTAAAEAAGGDLSKAATVAEFQAVTKDHPKSPAAGSAQVLLADKQWADGDQDGSIETLRGFISSYPEHPGLPSAKASLASRLLQQGKDGDAEPIFRDLADGAASKYLAPYALINLGDIAKKAGKLDEAEAAYKRVQDSFATSPFADNATKHLKLLHFKMPTEIDAPPPAPTPAPGAPGATTIPGAANPDKVEMPSELEGNPLGNILGEGAPAVPPAPVEEEPAKPETPPAPPEQPVTPPQAEEPAKPEGTPPAGQ